MNRTYLQDRMNDMLVQADEMQKTIDTMTRMIALMNQLNAATHSMVGKTHEMVAEITELRDLSLGASFGLSVLFWQHLLGIELQFMVMAMAVIILLAVGADYNLLLVARMKEEIPAGINTGIIRAMGGSGSVVISAGRVFAFTMMSMSVRLAPRSDWACCSTPW